MRVTLYGKWYDGLWNCVNPQFDARAQTEHPTRSLAGSTASAPLSVLCGFITQSPSSLFGRNLRSAASTLTVLCASRKVSLSWFEVSCFFVRVSVDCDIAIVTARLISRQFAGRFYESASANFSKTVTPCFIFFLKPLHLCLRNCYGLEHSGFKYNICITAIILNCRRFVFILYMFSCTHEHFYQPVLRPTQRRRKSHAALHTKRLPTARVCKNISKDYNSVIK